MDRGILSEEAVVSHWRKLTNSALPAVRVGLLAIEHLQWLPVTLMRLFLLAEAERTFPAAGPEARGHSSSG